ncbi:hypothetical protein VM95_03340 [Streptomyces rubellomurinus]|uniref:Uncharacterized protein n=2 Tax=Streptomyces TaxID=1883 RepID=A0A0F2TJE8_STRR3|nr:hypothetical protein VM95_03340 [Streptomyces rubellomurinus]
MRWAEVPEGLAFTLYDVVQPMVRGVEVPGTPQDAARWKTAHDAYQSLLSDAEDVVRHAHGVRCKAGFMVDHRSVRLLRYGMLPHRSARSRRLFAECAARMRTYEEAYRPVLEEIEARLPQASADPS